MLILTLMGLASCSTIEPPIVIAHRGASGYLPEHTLESAALAFSQGADYIEQDIVISKDGVLIVLHDIHLETVTNVESIFPDKARSDGRYYALDFTLEELRQLRVHERQNTDGSQVFPNRYQGTAQFSIATFEEHIELVTQLNRQFNKSVGFYPEIKSPAWHLTQGVDISQKVINILRKHELDDFNKPIYLQCFDFAELKRIRNALGAQLKLVQLIADNSWNESSTDYIWLQSEQGIKEVSLVAQGIGPWLPQLFDLQTLEAKPLHRFAKALNLSIHPYTHRIDQLPGELSNNQLLSILTKQLQVDGVFTDFTPNVVAFLLTNKL